MAAFLLGIGIAACVIFCKEKKISIANVLVYLIGGILWIYMLFHMDQASVVLILLLIDYGIWRFIKWARTPIYFDVRFPESRKDSWCDSYCEDTDEDACLEDDLEQEE